MITVVLRCKVNLGWNSRDVGVGESDVFADVAPVRIHERDVSTEQNTELKEKEIKTVFLSGSAGRDAAAALGQVAAKPKTRSIGVGDSKVYDLTDAAGESSVQVSQSNNNQVSGGETIGPHPADGSVTRGGSTSLRGRVRSPHMAKLQAASVPLTLGQLRRGTDGRIAVSLNAHLRQWHNIGDDKLTVSCVP